jgi:regulator of Ty1 transposition protein 103
VFQVDIWQERRVFGSRAGAIKDVMLGTAPQPVLDMSKKRSHTSAIKIVKRDSRSVKLVSFSTPSTRIYFHC